MFWKLRKKFIFIASLSFLLVFILLFSVISLISTAKTNASLDALTDMLAENGGRFPDIAPERPGLGNNTPPRKDGINTETPFSTRYFTVFLDKNSDVIRVDTRAVASVSDAEAEGYAASALQKGEVRGWAGRYRYLLFPSGDGTGIVFVDGTTQRTVKNDFLYISLFVFAGGGAVVLLLIVIFSRRAVRPAAEAEEKQKQFITDANHELKTPLTLILANLDIAEAELGKNEWLDDIRTESRQMNDLVCRLVSLARTDEGQNQPVLQNVHISEVCAESVAYFRALAECKALRLTSDLAPDVACKWDEAALRQILSVLLDNALKYCDGGGEISVTLKKEHRHPVLWVENDFVEVSSLPLDRLFDRFYRADKARTGGNGFGIGLSLAKALAEKNRATLTVQNITGKKIRFTLKF